MNAPDKAPLDSATRQGAELRLIALPGIPLVNEGDDLALLIFQALELLGERLVEGDVLVLAQKIVSKIEGRLRRLDEVLPSHRAIALATETGKDARLVELMLQEANEIRRVGHDVLIFEHKSGFVMANAGIDQSNIEQGPCDEMALLLPRDPDASCAGLRARLLELTGVSVGVIINDSHGRAWRNGTVGVALGVAGVPALLDLRGVEDLYGRRLRSTEVGLADELASAASLLMGQTHESRPIVLVRGVPYTREGANARELVRPRERDLFR